MKRINGKLISFAITGVILAVFCWYFFTHLEDFALLLRLNPLFVIAILLIDFLAIVSNGFFMKIAAGVFDKRLDTKETIKVSFISTAGNFFAPAGSGLGIRAVYLKKRHKLAYSDYLAIVIYSYLFVFIVSALLGLIGLLLIGIDASVTMGILIILFGGLLVASALALLIRFNFKEETISKSGKILNFVMVTANRVTRGRDLVLGRPKIAATLMLLVVVNAGFSVLLSLCLLASVGLSIGIGALILFSMLGSLSLFINLTPGNLGVKEAVYLATSTLIGLSAAEILSVSLIDRVTMFIMLLVLWIFFGRNFTRSDALTKD